MLGVVHPLTAHCPGGIRTNSPKKEWNLILFLEAGFGSCPPTISPCLLGEVATYDSMDRGPCLVCPFRYLLKNPSGTRVVIVWHGKCVTPWGFPESIVPRLPLETFTGWLMSKALEVVVNLLPSQQNSGHQAATASTCFAQKRMFSLLLAGVSKD